MADNLELKVVFTAVDKFIRPVNAITKGAREAAKALKENTNRAEELNRAIAKIDAFKKVERESAITANAIKKTERQMSALREEIAKTGAATEAQSKELEKLKDKSKSLEATTDKLRKHEIDLSAALRLSGIDTKDLTSAREHLVSASAGALMMSQKLQSELDAENRKVRRLKAAEADLSKMRERAGKLRSAGTSMTIGGGAMLAAEMVPIKAFAEAEDSATQLRVALMKSGGAVSSEFVEINALAERLGNRLPGTTSDFQNMMTMLVRQGMPAKTILGGLGEATALLGVQLKMPMEASAEFAAKLQDATRTSEKDMLGLMDVIQRTFYLGVDQNNMLEAFKGLGPVMDMIKNKGLEGTKALAPFVVMMDQAGMRGESAGNAIRKVVSRSLDVGNIRSVMGDLKKSKGIDLNLDFTNGKGEFGGIDRMMAELSKLKRFDTVTRLSILKDIYGDDKETNEVLSKIIEQGKDGYTEVIAKMGAQASLQERVNMQLGTLKNLWDAASGTFTNALVAFGEAISPQLKALTEWIGRTAEATQRWAREHPELSKALMLTVGGIGALLVTLGGLALAASAILGPFAMARFLFSTLGINGFGAMSLLGRGFGIVASAITPLSGLFATFSAVLAATPIGWVIAGIAALAAAGALIYVYWEPIKAFFAGFWEGLSATVGPALQALWSAIKGFVGSAAGLLDMIPGWGTIVMPILKAIANGVSEIFGWLGRLLAPTDATTAAARNMGTVFGEIVGNIYGYFASLPTKLLEIGKQMIDGMITGITSRWDSLKSTVTDIGDKSVKWVQDKLDMHSPSRVFAELGGYVMQGFGQGMTDGENGPLDALGSLSKRLAAIGAGVVISGSAAAGGTMPNTGGMAVTINIYGAPGQNAGDIRVQVEQALENIERRRQSQARSRLRDTD